MSVEERIRQFIASSFLFDSTDVGPGDHDSLLEVGIIDSTGVLELVLFVSEEFGIDVPLADVVPANFDSISGLASYVRRRLAESVALEPARPAARVEEALCGAGGLQT